MNSTKPVFGADPVKDPETCRLLEQLEKSLLPQGTPLDSRFEDRLRQAVAQAERTRERVAVHILEVEAPADQGWAIAVIAHRVGALVRESDAWTQLTTGKYVVLQRAIGKPEGAMFLARRLLACATAPVQEGETTVRLGATVGVCFHVTGIKPRELLTRAELARRQGRNDGSLVRCWQSAAFDASSPFGQQETLLRALQEREIFLEYQPQVELANGRLSGFEALARWRHPDLGVLGPYTFVPLAEHNGLIFELGEWVLRDACRRCREWNARADFDTPVAVNVSPIQLLSEGFAAQVQRILEQSGLRPDLLELELTETTSVHGSDETIATLRDLKAMGVRLALDDFGTGYNSLSYLHQLPVDRIKTPKEFVLEAADGAGSSLIEAIAILGRHLGLEVVAEGVETEAHLRTVRDAGCHFGQGFLWGRPAAEVSAIARPVEERMRPLPWSRATSAGSPG